MTKAATKSKGKAIDKNRDSNGLFQIGNFLGFKPAIATVEEINRRLTPYLQDCINNDLPILVSGIALSCSISEETYRDYIKGVMDERIKPLELLDEKGKLIKTITASEYLKKVKYISEHSLQIAGGKSKFNPVFTMFLLKQSHYGYTDKQEVAHSIGFDLDKLHTAKESQHAITEGPKANDPIVN